MNEQDRAEVLGMLSEHCEQMCALLCRKGVHDEANAYRDEMDRIDDDRAAHDAAEEKPPAPEPPPIPGLHPDVWEHTGEQRHPVEGQDEAWLQVIGGSVTFHSWATGSAPTEYGARWILRRKVPQEPLPTPPPGHKLDGERHPKGGEWFYASWGAWGRATYDWDDGEPVRWIAVPDPQKGEPWVMKDGSLWVVRQSQNGGMLLSQPVPAGPTQFKRADEFDNPASREDWAAAFPGGKKGGGQ